MFDNSLRIDRNPFVAPRVFAVTPIASVPTSAMISVLSGRSQRDAENGLLFFDALHPLRLLDPRDCIFGFVCSRTTLSEQVGDQGRQLSEHEFEPTESDRLNLFHRPQLDQFAGRVALQKFMDRQSVVPRQSN